MNHSRADAVDAIIQAFDKAIPFLKFGEGNDALVLASRKAGEQIDDPECDTIGEALRTGIFRRYETVQRQTWGFRWLYLCPADGYNLEEALSDTFDGMENYEIESIPSDVSFQMLRFSESRVREPAAPNL